VKLEDVVEYIFRKKRAILALEEIVRKKEHE
jgi:hypothetical protein